MECSFDPAAIEPGPLVEDGYPTAWAYHCMRCGLYHWCVPACEARGTTSTADAALDAEMAAIRMLYPDVQGAVSFVAPDWPDPSLARTNEATQ